MNVQQIIGEVAQKHGVLLRAEDPILVSVTLHELVVSDLVKQIELTTQSASVASATASAQQVEAAKKIAETLVTGAANFVGAQVRAAGSEVQREIARAVEGHVASLRAEAALVQRERRTALWCAIAAVVSAVVTTGVWLLAILR